MGRIKFRVKGQQRRFIKSVMEKLNCPSLRGLLQFGFDCSYSCLKNYYNENRLMSEDFFDDLCSISELKKEDIDFCVLRENWGQVVGGKRKKVKRFQKT